MKKVTLSLEGNYKTSITVRNHTLLADEPEEHGGDDTGPTPFELFIASIGSCAAFTMQMYASRKGWPLKKIEIEMQHTRVNREDVPDYDNPDNRAKVDVITKKIVLHGDLTVDQKTRIVEIGGRCPVHRAILNQPHFIDEVALD